MTDLEITLGSTNDKLIATDSKQFTGFFPIIARHQCDHG